ncbi:ATP-binding protein [Saccharibacillus alkalitolerans]|uniref:histidine kinase n=1 Tax=Saccharibacillus alkalitolerans TaxID=2705290 RepID=A0ABX0F909_9BACL|nr:ATP-binding protein [Saccharibacillus alkalitolerans]NGZ77451.1 PAS domain S-box protein [Saccharibacillus alkalitolerans]
MELFNVFIIQFLLASLPVLLMPSLEMFLRKRASEPLPRHGWDSVAVAFAYASSVSLLLCWILDAGSLRIDGRLALLPTGMGILYGAAKGGLPLVALYVLMGYLFSNPGELLLIGLEGLILLALALSRSRLLSMRNVRRRFLLAAWLLAAYFPHAAFRIGRAAAEGTGAASALPGLAAELLAAAAAGVLLLNSRRDVQHRYLLSEQAGAMREKMIQEETKLQALMRTLPGFALTLDRSGRITGVNDRAFSALSNRMPSMTREAVVGLSFSELIQSIGMEADPLFLQALEQTIREDRAIERAFGFGGRKFHAYFSPAHTEAGEVVGAVCSLYDVTEIERMRLELEDMNRLRLIGQMAAGVTHEVRNPMAVVRGYLQILQRKTPAEYAHYYKIVLEELDRAGGIIDDFLSLARAKREMNERRTLRSVVEELWPLLQADANLRGQTIRLEGGEEGEAMPMHPGEIKQLVLNLARNALEAMGDKGELVIAVEESEDGVRLRVRDNGPGISEETLERIKQPFFTTKKTGTGLGLALCIGIAERHGGTLTIDSAVGEGTEVRVDFVKSGKASEGRDGSRG